MYSDDRQVASGCWPVVGHSEELRGLFPEPELVHHYPREGRLYANVGPFGAETGTGEMRNLTRKEAEEIGLLKSSYEQIRSSEEVEKILDLGRSR